MSKKMCTVCDLCGKIFPDEEGDCRMTLETPLLNDRYDLCLDCMGVLRDWIKSRGSPAPAPGVITTADITGAQQ